MTKNFVSGLVRKSAPQLASIAPVPYLTEVAVGNMFSEAAARGFIGDKIAPKVTVPALEFKYLDFDIGHWFARKAKKIASGNTGDASNYERVDYNGSYKDGVLDIWGVGRATPRHFQGLAGIDPETMDAKYVGAQMALIREYEILSTVFKTSTWKGNGGAATDFAGAASTALGSNQIAYVNASGADTVADIAQLQRLVAIQNGGLRPNTLVLGDQVATALHTQTAMKGRVGGGALGKTVVDPSFLAEVFAGLGITNLLINRAVENSGTDEAPSMAAMGGAANWDKMIWLGFVSPTPAVDSPSALYHFVGDDNIIDGMVDGVVVERWFDNDSKKFVTDGTTVLGPKRTSLVSGVLVTNAVQT